MSTIKSGGTHLVSLNVLPALPPTTLQFGRPVGVSQLQTGAGVTVTTSPDMLEPE